MSDMRLRRADEKLLNAWCAEVALGAHANAGFRAHILACSLAQARPKTQGLQVTAPAAAAGDVILRNYAILNAVFTPFSL